MDDLEEYIEKLQNLDHHTKIKIMWIGVPVVMAVVIFIWLSFSNFGLQGEKVVSEESAVVGQEEISKFEVLKNGLAVTIKEIGNLLKDFKEKISQTNTFEITAPEQNLENTASTTNKK